MKKMMILALLSASATAVQAHRLAKHSDQEKAILKRSIVTHDEHRDAPPEVVEAAAYIATQSKESFQAPPGYEWASGQEGEKNTHVFVPRNGKGAVIKIGKAQRAVVHGAHGSQRFEAPEAFMVSNKPVRVIPQVGHVQSNPLYGKPNENITKFMRWLIGREYMFTAPDQVTHRVAIARAIHEDRDAYPAVDTVELWLAPFSATTSEDPIDDEHYAVLSTFVRATPLTGYLSEQDERDIGTLLGDAIRIARDFHIVDLHFDNILITRTHSGRIMGYLIDAEDLFRDATLHMDIMKQASGMLGVYQQASPLVPKNLNPLLRAGSFALKEDQAKRKRYAMNLLLNYAHVLGFFIPWPHLGKEKMKDLEWLQETFEKLSKRNQRSVLAKLRSYDPDKVEGAYEDYSDENVEYMIKQARDEQMKHVIKHRPRELIAASLGKRFRERKAAAQNALMKKYILGALLATGALGAGGVWASRRH